MPLMISKDFNSILGELPDFLTYLQETYRAERKLSSAVTDPSDAFIMWAKAHLSENRPSEVFAVDRNQGIQLTNGQRIKISPDDAISAVPSGNMANPDNSIAIISNK
jgi:hypothetical protein